MLLVVVVVMVVVQALLQGIVVSILQGECHHLRVA